MIDFAAIRFILVATTHPGNIGAAARAMKTMGFTNLYLVKPKYFPDVKAVAMAAGADDLLQHCVVVDSLAEAIADCQLVMATSARIRSLSLPVLSVENFAHHITSQPVAARIALVFGREHAGLTNEELLQCRYQINIPANPDYSSLNLAQAVQIIAYELRIKTLQSKTKIIENKETIATANEVENFYQHLTDVMIETDFYKPGNPGRIQQRIRRLFNRVGLEQNEVNILRGILSHVQKALAMQTSKVK